MLCIRLICKLGLIASHSAAKLTMSASSSTVQPEIQRNYSTPKFAMGASRSSIHQHLPLSAHRGIAGVNLIQGGGCNAPQVPAQHFNPIAASNNFNNHEVSFSDIVVSTNYMLCLTNLSEIS